MSPMTAMKTICGAMNGMVMARSMSSRPAPSMAAASYICFGTSCKPARKMTIQPPTPHVLIRMSDGFDQAGSCIQPVPLMPIFSRMAFSMPLSGFSSHSHRTELATTGTMDGR